MEPISLIINALVTGATAAAGDVGGTTVKDAYNGLKTLIKRKFEGDPLGQGLVDGKPEELKIEQVKEKTWPRNWGCQSRLSMGS